MTQGFSDPKQDSVEETALLLIDDDVELCSLMSEYFVENGFAVEIAVGGRQGLARAIEGRHDLVILDIMLPDLDGLEVLRQLRRKSFVPVIMLTARTAEADRVAGLEEGADDYLPKPFSPGELLARIRAVLRRSRDRSPRPEAYHLAGITLLPGTREVRLGRQIVNLTTTEYEILEYLVRCAGRAVSRNELTTALYRRRATPFDRVLDVHVSHLRRKLGAWGERIRTVRGMGYVVRDESRGERG
jgi:two-component system response regulator CpxR